MRRARGACRHSRAPRRPDPAGAFDGRGFVVTQAMTSLTGSAGEDFASILRALGYRMEKRPPLPVKPVEAPAAQAAPTEEAAPTEQVAPAEEAAAGEGAVAAPREASEIVAETPAEAAVDAAPDASAEAVPTV